MRVLVMGCGSIGRRHTADLLAMPEVENVTVCTSHEGCHDDLVLSDPEHGRRVTVVSSWEEGSFDAAIVASETARHESAVTALASRGIDMLVEKPLATTVAEAERIAETVAGSDAKAWVGYNLRFLGALRWVKARLDEEAIGRPYFARAEVGQYLPDWRPGRDYRESYSASAARGGGVALDLSHEVDYMRYLFGDPEDWRVMRSKVSDLEIDTEDLFEGVYRYDDGFVCSVHMDYLRRERRRTLRIVGSAGEIECDLAAGLITAMTGDGLTEIDDPALFDTTRTYVDELAWFLGERKAGPEGAATLEDGVEAVRLIEDRDVRR